jgi:hypothetical protein
MKKNYIVCGFIIKEFVPKCWGCYKIGYLAISFNKDKQPSHEES